MSTPEWPFGEWFDPASPAESMWIGGQFLRILHDGASGGASGGAFGSACGGASHDGSYDLVEVTHSPGSMCIPTRPHSDCDEHVLVLDGHIEVILRDEFRLLGPGDHLRSPVGESLGMTGLGVETCRVLLYSQPSGLARWCRTASTPSVRALAEDIADLSRSARQRSTAHRLVDLGGAAARRRRDWVSRRVGVPNVVRALPLAICGPRKR